MEDKIDIHKTEKRYDVLLEKLAADESMIGRNRDLLLKFVWDCKIGKTVKGRAKKKIGKKRIMKYRGDLFTFLDYDGIPWNNNNAEHAVKHFAKYRRLANGRFAERGLRDYLKLLSVYETCKYKGVRFLEFLLSKERDIDSFAERN